MPHNEKTSKMSDLKGNQKFSLTEPLDVIKRKPKENLYQKDYQFNIKRGF